MQPCKLKADHFFFIWVTLWKAFEAVYKGNFLSRCTRVQVLSQTDTKQCLQEWQQWCELCQLFYTAASAHRRVNGFVQNWNPALELSQTCRLLKKREVSVSHSSWRSTKGLRDSLAQDRAAAGNRNKNQGKKPDTKLPCHVFLLKYQGLSPSPLPSHSPSQDV